MSTMYYSYDVHDCQDIGYAGQNGTQIKLRSQTYLEDFLLSSAIVCAVQGPVDQIVEDTQRRGVR